MKIRLHSKGIKGSGVIKDGEHAGALFGAVLEINGHAFDRISDLQVVMGEEFTKVTCTFIPGEIEFVTHTNESWLELCEQADLDIKYAELAEDTWRSVRRGDGRVIARHDGS